MCFTYRFYVICNIIQNLNFSNTEINIDISSKETADTGTKWLFRPWRHFEGLATLFPVNNDESLVRGRDDVILQHSCLGVPPMTSYRGVIVNHNVTIYSNYSCVGVPRI